MSMMNLEYLLDCEPVKPAVGKRSERTQSFQEPPGAKTSRVTQDDAEGLSAPASLLEPASSARDKNAAKSAGAKRESKNDKQAEVKLMQITAALTALVLSNSRAIAVLNSVLIRVAVFKKDKLDVLTGVKEATQRYNATTKKLSPDERAAYHHLTRSFGALCSNY